ncbi:NosD domain-containing protein [Paenibacillus sp. GYB004]|uniref:right-handed parallel beta-helix repeat-containing protein n=1 Tax=Paenibacillus sp. GYB004 TaxID=2994393 RepID=UPI002F968D7F
MRISAIGKVLAIVCLSVGLGIASGERTRAADAAMEAANIQRLLDEARAGETVRIPPGTYEGSIVIGKPLRIEADGDVTIVARSGKPAVHITADGVQIDELKLVNESSRDSSAVLVTANDAKLYGLKIRTSAFGIKLEGANRSEIRNADITWGGPESAKLTEKRNGIDLYKSDDNVMTGNTISSMHDAIYLESSNGNKIESNQLEKSRYGVHCMYADRTTIRGNTGIYNVTGAMIMSVKNSELSGNSFAKQSENVHSQGILMFDVQSTRVVDNAAEGNRVGIYVEQSQHNELSDNVLTGNFIGFQLLDSENNRISGNELIGSVVDAEARDSRNNVVSGNYWDSFRGIDTDGDGRSDTAYAINPFFQALAKAKPAYQLFFQSPGMTFLESLFQGGRQEWTTDPAPLMKPPSYGTKAGEAPSAAATGILASLLLAASVVIIYYTGVRRS